MSLRVELTKVEVQWRGSPHPLFRLERLEIPNGAKVLIRGSSGRGKTTLLHLMAGLFLPSQGSVTVGETRLDTLSDEARCYFREQNVGMIFQKLNLLEHLSALENVTVGRRSGMDDEKARSALRALGLEHALHRRAALLSLGEQQRVAAARALALKPKLILADEPTSSLDDENARAVTDTLLSLRDCTTVVVSHDHRLEKGFDQVLDFTKLVRA